MGLVVMDYTSLEVSTSEFVANSINRIDDNAIFGGGDGAPARFVGQDLCQSTQVIKPDLPTSKAPKVNAPISSNLDFRVLSDKFGEGEILVKFDGHGVYH